MVKKLLAPGLMANYALDKTPSVMYNSYIFILSLLFFKLDTMAFLYPNHRCIHIFCIVENRDQWIAITLVLEHFLL